MQHQKTFDVNSLVPLALRLVVGWTYFSAFLEATYPRKQINSRRSRLYRRKIQSLFT